MDSLAESSHPDARTCEWSGWQGVGHKPQQEKQYLKEYSTCPALLLKLASVMQRPFVSHVLFEEEQTSQKHLTMTQDQRISGRTAMMLLSDSRLESRSRRSHVNRRRYRREYSQTRDSRRVFTRALLFRYKSHAGSRQPILQARKGARLVIRNNAPLESAERSDRRATAVDAGVCTPPGLDVLDLLPHKEDAAREESASESRKESTKESNLPLLLQRRLDLRQSDQRASHLQFRRDAGAVTAAEAVSLFRQPVRLQTRRSRGVRGVRTGDRERT